MFACKPQSRNQATFTGFRIKAAASPFEATSRLYRIAAGLLEQQPEEEEDVKTCGRLIPSAWVLGIAGGSRLSCKDEEAF